MKLKLPLGDNDIGLGFSNRTRRSADQSGDVTLTTGTEYDFHTVLYDMRRYDSFNLQVTGHSAFIAFGPKCWASPFRNVYLLSENTSEVLVPPKTKTLRALQQPIPTLSKSVSLGEEPGRLDAEILEMVA